MMSLLVGCSYTFTRGVEGEYTATGRPLLGRISSENEKTGGTLALGSAENQHCEGRYEVIREGVSILGLSVRDRVYSGKIYCLDGRAGRFELVSKRKGRTGSIEGEISGEAFRAKLIEQKHRECADDECRWGLRWTYENQLRDMQTYRKVEDENRPGFKKPMTDGAIRPADGI